MASTFRYPPTQLKNTNKAPNIGNLFLLCWNTAYFIDFFEKMMSHNGYRDKNGVNR